MTAKPSFEPEQLKPTSGRNRMTINSPVEVAREPDTAEQASSRRRQAKPN